MFSIPRRMPCYETLCDLHLDLSRSSLTDEAKVEDYRLAQQHLADRLDRLAVVISVPLELREVMIQGQVKPVPLMVLS
jgi:cell fate (sporulation/competence/biofilm development) regulator YlbF (YheA/YmcA/DUF963 family)